MSTPLIVVAAPSGAGKSSFVARAIKEFPNNLVDSVSYTTRPPREGEIDGDPYKFLSKEEFSKLQKEDFFIESATVHQHSYGTPRHQLDDAWRQGKFLIMDVDVQGAATFRKLYPDAHFIFIHPPSFEELRRRLEKRDAGTTNNLEVRLKNAEKEVKEAHLFEYELVNDDFEESYGQFKKILEKLFANQ